MNKKLLILFKSTGFMLLLFTFTPLIGTIFNYESFSTNNQIIFSFITDIIFLSIIIFSYRKTLKKDFIAFKKNLGSNLDQAFKYWLIGFIIMIISNILIIFVCGNSIAGNEEKVRSFINIAPFYMIFSTIIYAPITEELIFRKGFRDLFKNKYLFIMISGLTFGSLHVLSSIESIYSLFHLIPYCSLGIAFSALYTKSNNIFSSISMHFLHNTIAVGLYFLGSGLI